MRRNGAFLYPLLAYVRSMLRARNHTSGQAVCSSRCFPLALQYAGYLSRISFASQNTVGSQAHQDI